LYTNYFSTYFITGDIKYYPVINLTAGPILLEKETAAFYTMASAKGEEDVDDPFEIPARVSISQWSILLS
jgi:hypothetical protein